MLPTVDDGRVHIVVELLYGMEKQEGDIRQDI